MNAFVVFDNSGAHWTSRWLKPGFRHCAAVTDVNGYWLLGDLQKTGPRYTIIAEVAHDLAGEYRRHGYTVIELTRNPRPLRAPWVATNCVGFVKTFLGLNSLAITPYQLYRSLK